MKIKVFSKSGVLPEYETKGAAGMDLRAHIGASDETNIRSGLITGAVLLLDDTGTPNKIVISSRGRAAIPTGLHIELPEGYEAQIRARSGLALKQGIMVVNGVGTVDEDFRGEIKVIITNTGYADLEITNGMKIAQMVINKVEKFPLHQVESVAELGTTKRGEGGFGSTGV